MAAVARTVTPSLATKLPSGANRVGPKRTGAVIIPGPCYIGTDDLVYQSTGVANNAAAQVDGWAIDGYPNVGGAITLYRDIDMSWGPATLTPAAPLYLGTTAGELDTATTTGGLTSIATVVELHPNQGTPHAVIRCKQTR